MESFVYPSEALNHEPTELCPHPGYWTAPDPYSTENEVSMLVASFVKALQPEYILEIGCHRGYTTKRIAEVMVENAHGEFVSLDIDDAALEIAINYCAGLPVNIVKDDSLVFIPDKPIDFLFIDGHENNRAKDLKHYMPYLSPHAIIICHDMDYYLTEMVKILKIWEGGEHILLHTPRGLLILTR